MSKPLTRKLLVTVCALALGLALACSRPKPVVAPEVSTPPSSTATPGAAAGATSDVSPEPTVAPAATPESGVAAGELPADIEQLNKAGYLKDTFFDTNKSDLRPDARDTLAADAAWLKSHRSIKLLVEGHCDERNTAEYNLALGWRRANAVKSYLVSLGVDAERIATISYGEERPFATCHDESCWQQNRRAHLVITAR